jgi:hypothetical protein
MEFLGRNIVIEQRNVREHGNERRTNDHPKRLAYSCQDAVESLSANLLTKYKTTSLVLLHGKDYDSENVN